MIADDPQDIRRPTGNIVTAVGTPALPITVDISGVTIDGDGVAAKAGIVFLDAQGSLTRSRVTDIVTSESPGAFDQPGGYRSEFLGYGVAQVTAADTAPAGAGPRELELRSVRIDEYNLAGVLIDGGDATRSRRSRPPASTSPRRSRARRSSGAACAGTPTSTATAAGPTRPATPIPSRSTEGPLFGQDGVRIAAGARGAITGSIVTQNLVQGEDAPVRNAPDNNEHLPEARRHPAGRSGHRQLVGDPHQHRRQRLRRPQRRRRTARPTPPIRCRRRTTGGGCGRPSALRPRSRRRSTTVRRSPPTTNPPYPENPVNGAASRDGSTTVDFLPFRDGPQSDPNSGQFPVVPAPLPVDDAAPAVTLGAPQSAKRGTVVKLTAEPVDDFGIRQVTFFQGATALGATRRRSTPPTFTVPEGRRVRHLPPGRRRGGGLARPDDDRDVGRAGRVRHHAARAGAADGQAARQPDHDPAVPARP